MGETKRPFSDQSPAPHSSRSAGHDPTAATALPLCPSRRLLLGIPFFDIQEIPARTQRPLTQAAVFRVGLWDLRALLPSPP